jgi:hypothetical protein
LTAVSLAATDGLLEGASEIDCKFAPATFAAAGPPSSSVGADSSSLGSAIFPISGSDFKAGLSPRSFTGGEGDGVVFGFKSLVFRSFVFGSLDGLAAAETGAVGMAGELIRVDGGTGTGTGSGTGTGTGPEVALGLGLTFALGPDFEAGLVGLVSVPAGLVAGVGGGFDGGPGATGGTAGFDSGMSWPEVDVVPGLDDVADLDALEETGAEPAFALGLGFVPKA